MCMCMRAFHFILEEFFNWSLVKVSANYNLCTFTYENRYALESLDIMFHSFIYFLVVICKQFILLIVMLRILS